MYSNPIALDRDKKTGNKTALNAFWHLASRSPIPPIPPMEGAVLGKFRNRTA
jgi:hypothetical protein